MNKKIISLSLALFLVLLSLSGCSDEKRIDKAAIVETVVVNEQEGATMYSFYLLGSDDNPESVTVGARSFEEACSLAEKQYIPNLSLAKLDLYLANEKIFSKVMQKDVDFLAKNYIISPNIILAVCDNSTMKNISEEKKLPEKIKNYIILNKKNNSQVSINLLSVFNKFYSPKQQEFDISYINSEEELKILSIKITAEK